MLGTIYGLHAEDGVVRYVGKTTRTNPLYRLGEHRTASKAGRNEPVYKWMREAGESSIEMKILEQTHIPILDKLESEWIDALPNLLNIRRLLTEDQVVDIRSGRVTTEEWARENGYAWGTVNAAYWGYSYRNVTPKRISAPKPEITYPLRKSNTSGYRNVTRQGGRWVGQIMVGGRNHRTASYDDPAEAYEAVRALRAKLT